MLPGVKEMMDDICGLGCAPQSVTDGVHATIGAWLMDSCWTELMVRLGRVNHRAKLTVVPN